MNLSDQQQAALMFLAFVLPSLAAWFGIGSPTDHASLALLGSSFIGGVIAYIKESLGGKAPAKA
jgi:hypothetical protein